MNYLYASLLFLSAAAIIWQRIRHYQKPEVKADKLSYEKFREDFEGEFSGEEMDLFSHKDTEVDVALFCLVVSLIVIGIHLL